MKGKRRITLAEEENQIKSDEKKRVRYQKSHHSSCQMSLCDVISITVNFEFSFNQNMYDFSSRTINCIKGWVYQLCLILCL